MRTGVSRVPIRMVKETPVSASLDGGDHIGYVVAHRAMTGGHRERLPRAGIAIVGANNTWYTGMLSYYAEMAAARGLVSIIASNASPWVAPHGATEGRFGTNPICVGFPSRADGTGHLGHRHVGHHARRGRARARLGQQLPEDVAFDATGRPTRDPGRRARRRVCGLGRAQRFRSRHRRAAAWRAGWRSGDSTRDGRLRHRGHRHASGSADGGGRIQAQRCRYAASVRSARPVEGGPPCECHSIDPGRSDAVAWPKTRSTWPMLSIRSWWRSRRQPIEAVTATDAIRVRKTPRMKMCASRIRAAPGKKFLRRKPCRPIATRIAPSPDNRRSRSGWCRYRRAVRDPVGMEMMQCIDRSPDFSPCFSWRFRGLDRPSSAGVSIPVIVVFEDATDFGGFAASYRADDRAQGNPAAWNYVNRGVAGFVQSLERGRGFRADHVYSRALRGFAARLSAQQIAELESDARVAYVEVDGTMEIVGQGRSGGGGGGGGGESDVAMGHRRRLMPTIAVQHWLATATAQSATCAPTSSTPESTPGMPIWASRDTSTLRAASNRDCNGHGTHVAGTVGARRQ